MKKLIIIISITLFSCAPMNGQKTAEPEKDIPKFDFSQPETEIGPKEEISGITETIKPRTAQGFRIQIGAFSDKETAIKFAQEAKARLNEKVYYRQMEAYYKVAVGDCQTREEAELLLKKIISIDPKYKDALIISSEIVINE